MLIIFLAEIGFLFYFFLTEPDFGLTRSFKYNPLQRFFYAMEDHWSWLFAGSFFTIVLSGIATLIISIIVCANVNPSVHRDSVEPVYALEDSVNNYVWRYRTDDKIFLSYITEDEDGLAINSINAKYVRIKYSHGEPTIEKYYRYFEPNFLNYIIFPLYEPTYILNVPFDSITTDYNIDLKGG